MYDATGGPSGPSGNLAFAGVVVLVITGVFLAVWKGPDLLAGDGAGGASPARAAGAGRLADIMPDLGVEGLDRALAAFDPAAHKALVTAIGEAAPDDAKVLQEIVVTAVGDIVADNQQVFAAMPVSHVDRVLTRTVDGLRAASSSRNRWCRGQTYLDYRPAIERNAEIGAARLAGDISRDNAGLAQYLVDVGTIMIEGGAEARRSPAERGGLTPQDEAALQGVLFSMMADPQVMGLMLSGQGGADSEKAMAALDFCGLGVTAMMALRTLPQETKGRAWAHVVRQDGADFGKLSELAAF